MALTYSIDLVDGASLEKQRQDSTGLITATATRIALVKGMAGSPALALASARKVVEADFPIGKSYDPYDPTIPFCIVTGYRAMGVTGTIAKIEILYSTPQFNPQQGQPLIITDDTTEVPDKMQFDPATGQQLVISYADPNDGGKKIKFVPEISFPSLMRVIVMTGVISQDNLPIYQSALRTVNDGDWRGVHGVGFWRVTRLNTQYTQQAQYVMATMEVKSWLEKDWSVWKFLREPASGKIVAVRGNDVLNAKNKPYSFGLIDSHNGFIRVGPFRTSNFPSLFNIS